MGVGSQKGKAQKWPLTPNFLQIESQGLLSYSRSATVFNILYMRNLSMSADIPISPI